MSMLRPPIDRASRMACIGAALAAVLPLALVLPPWVGMTLLPLLAIAALCHSRDWSMSAWMRVPLTLGVCGWLMFRFGVGTGGGFGRDTAAALLAAMLMLKLLELRGVRDGRAVLSFSLFAVLAAFLQDRGPLTLGLALAATLACLASMARLAEVESPDGTAIESAGLRGRVGWIGRIAAVSIPLAVAAFFLFPRLANPLWALPQNSDEARTGLSDTMSPGDISNLFVDDTPVMRVQFDGPIPRVSELYWRGPVLSQFDGRVWQRSGWLSGLPTPELEPIGEPLSYTIEQEPTDRRYLFGLDLPLDSGVDQRINFERSLTTRRPLVTVSRVNLRSQPNYRLQPTLLRTLRSAYLSMPEVYNPRTRALVNQWREEGDDDRAIIRRALAWFNAEFRYTLNPLLLGRHSVDDFLFNTKAGYCEHYASAFAVMMRAAGIPSRVVTGYLGGYRNPIGNYVVVLQSDAHAWTEVWIEGEGWIRVDPTSAVAPERVDPEVESLPIGGGGGGWGRPVFDFADWMRRGWNDMVLGFDAVKQARLLAPLGIEQADWRQLTIGLMVAAAAALLITLLILLRPARSTDDALGQAWAAFCRRLARAGAPRPLHEDPQAYARRIAGRFPGQAEAIESLSRRYAQQRYAPLMADAQRERRLCDDLRRFRVRPEARR